MIQAPTPQSLRRDTTAALTILLFGCAASAAIPIPRITRFDRPALSSESLPKTVIGTVKSVKEVGDELCIEVDDGFGRRTVYRTLIDSEVSGLQGVPLMHAPRIGDTVTLYIDYEIQR